METFEPPAKTAQIRERRKRFMDCLLRSYGNVVRAWRHGLDRDHNDKMDFAEFSSAVRDVGYAGSARELWAELDLNGNGYVSLWVSAALMLGGRLDLRSWIRRRRGSCRSSWTALRVAGRATWAPSG